MLCVKLLYDMHYFMPDAIRYLNSYFGVHPFPSTTYFNCFGNETSLSNCQSSTSTSLCGSEDAAGVYCKGDVITGIYIVNYYNFVWEGHNYCYYTRKL